MKLKEEKVKEIIKKVHDDLNLSYCSKYPITFNAFDKGETHANFPFASWLGGFDYSDPESVGEDQWCIYPEYIITVNDEIGEAISYHYYTGHFKIHLNEKGKYELGNQLYR